MSTNVLALGRRGSSSNTRGGAPGVCIAITCDGPFHPCRGSQSMEEAWQRAYARGWPMPPFGLSARDYRWAFRASLGGMRAEGEAPHAWGNVGDCPGYVQLRAIGYS